MDKFRVQGPTKLQGKSQFPALKMLLCLSFLPLYCGRTGRDPERPETERRRYINKLLSQLGAKVERNGSVHIDAATLMYSAHLTIWLKPCVLLLGTGAAGSALWSGASFTTWRCTIGARPVDLHISGLEQLGAPSNWKKVTLKLPSMVV